MLVKYCTVNPHLIFGAFANNNVGWTSSNGETVNGHDKLKVKRLVVLAHVLFGQSNVRIVYRIMWARSPE